MLPILQLGPLAIRTSGLALLAGLWIALDVAERIGVKRGIDGNRTYNLALSLLAVGVISARLSFVIMNMQLYTEIQPLTRALLSVVALAPGTEYPVVGIIVAAGMAGLLIRRWKMPLGAVMDTYAPLIAIMVMGISMANLLSGEAYGLETDAFWGIPLWGAYRHPTQVLMAFAGLLVLVVLWRTGITKVGSKPSGFYMQISILMLCAAILLIEPLRADSPVILGDIRLWQVVSLAGIIGILSLITWQAPIQMTEGAV